MLQRLLLDETACVLLRNEFVALIASDAPAKETDFRRPSVEAILRTRYLQQRFGLSDVVMKVAAYVRAAPSGLFACVPVYFPRSSRDLGSIPNCFVRFVNKYCA